MQGGGHALQILTSITDLRESFNDDVKIMLPYQIDGKNYFDIFYKERGNPLFIQTPVASMPYKYVVYDDKYIYIDLVFSNQDLKVLLDSIAEFILNKIRKKKFIKRFMFKVDGTEKDIIPITKIDKIDKDIVKLRLKNSNIDAVTVFDIAKYKIDIRNLERNDRVCAIFQIDKLLIDDESISFQTKLIQIKKQSRLLYDPFCPTNRCLFIDTDEQNGEEDKYATKSINTPITSQIPTTVQEQNAYITENFERFSKMLKMGVPLMAVRQKMLLEGLNEMEIDLFILKQNKQSDKQNVHEDKSKNKPTTITPTPPKRTGGAPPPPPPPPPPPIMIKQTSSSGGGGLPFLADIKNNNFALKKVDLVSERLTIKSKILKNIDTSKMLQISLDDILSAKSRLKKNQQ